MMAGSELMWMTSIAVVLFGLICAAIVFWLAHRTPRPHSLPCSKTVVSIAEKETPDEQKTLRMTIINRMVNEGLEKGEFATSQIRDLVRATEEWVLREIEKGYSEQQLIAAMEKSGWDRDVARRVILRTAGGLEITEVGSFTSAP